MEQQFSSFLSHYGYFGIFLALSGGIIGFPFPDEILMTFVGYQVFKGNMSYFPAIVSAFGGASVGITVSYFLGKKLGLPFLKKFGPKIHITEEKLTKAQKLFLHYGNAWLTIGYFIPGVRHVNGYLSGIANLSLLRFGSYAYAGALLWSITFITLGHELGERWFLVEELLSRYKPYILLVIVITGLILALTYILITRRKQPLNKA